TRHRSGAHRAPRSRESRSAKKFARHAVFFLQCIFNTAMCRSPKSPRASGRRPRAGRQIEMGPAARASADRISYGNTIKKERDIARPFALGVRMFAVDCKPEVEKVARAAPGSRVFCRILSDCVGAEWPLSRKFGGGPGMAG